MDSPTLPATLESVLASPKYVRPSVGMVVDELSALGAEKHKALTAFLSRYAGAFLE